MKSLVARTFAVLVLASCFSGVTLAQDNSQTQSLKDYLAGQRFLVTYRKGGPVYGTYAFMTVHLCRSGNYMTFGQNRKQSVLDSHGEQVQTWRDQGRWDVRTVAGQLGVQYVSSSGQATFYPVSVGFNGQISVAKGMSVVHQGPAQCP